MGRDRELVRTRTLLLDDVVPLLTLTGPGGVGKTRLALAVAADVAAHFADGVVWVDLTPLGRAELVPEAIAGTLGIVPRPNRPVLDELLQQLHRQQLLLVLDNCEHILAAVAGTVAPLLDACPALQILAASRAPLRVRGEQIWPVEPLPLPAVTGSPGEAIAENDAVRLFVERAQAVRPRFSLTATNAATVAALCRALDGLPLALELAAARMSILSPETLLAQMTDRLHLLSDGPRDAPIRQQTMVATIGWSYDLLPPEAQEIFRRLAVFTGSFTLEAAVAVAGVADTPLSTTVRGINALVEQSLVHRIEGDGEPCFVMLETIRAFGLERLRESGEEAFARDRHAAWFIDWAAARETWVAAELADGRAILDQLAADHGNLHAALAWLRDSRNCSGLLALASDLNYFWTLRGRLHEGRQWLEWGLARGDVCSPTLRAHAQLALSNLYHVLHERELALEFADACLRHYRTTGDQPRIARAAAQAAVASLEVCEPAVTETYIGEALAAFDTIAGIPWTSRARSSLQILPGILAKNQGDVPRAEQLLGDVVASQQRIALESGAPQPYACWPLMAWGAVAHLARDFPVALERYQASLAHAWRFGEARCSAYALTRAASILAMNERWREAAWMLGAAEAFAEKIGLAFDQNIWSLTRAFGVPEPWQGPEDYVGQARAIRTAALSRGPLALPPVPAKAAAELWATGRAVPMEEAVTYALAISLETNPPPSPLVVAPMAGAPQDFGLTVRQREILALLCHRLTDPEIAARLFLSPRTVEGHVTQILGKLGVDNRRQAAAMAIRLGLV